MASAFFPNAIKPQIHGGQFTIIDNRRSVNQDGFDLLREHCAISAILDSRERFDPPRCAAETREALIDGVLAWIYGTDESASMAWLFGGAGAGKSALAQTISEIIQRKGRLAGSFFFSRTSTAERSDGNRLIPTLVFQLMSAFPLLKPHVEEFIHGDGGLLYKSPRTQMDLLFVEPLIALKSDITTTLADTHNLLKPRLIVIDGLDECNSQEIQVDLLRILADAIPHIPIPLRFLITSRPEGPITRTFDYDKSFQSLSIYRISLSDDENASSDIQQFLIQGFEEIHRTHPLRALLSLSWPSRDAINTLVRKSSSHFIYASTAMKYIQYTRGRPNDRLEVILGLSVPPTTDKPFAQLDALYTHIFMSLEESDRMSVNSVFGIMHLAGQEQYYYIKRSPIKLEEYLEMRAGEINLLLEPLFSLVALSDNREADVKVLHASLFDFLLDASRSSDLCLDLKKAHGIIADSWLKQCIGDTLWHSPTTRLICWAFLFHSHHSVLSKSIKDYLTSFPLLYDLILHSKFLMQHLYKDRALWSYIFVILEIFFDLLLSKGFDNSQYLHAVHTAQVEQRFQSIRKDIGPSDSDALDNMAHERLFDNILHQNVHQVYRAFFSLFLAFNGMHSLPEILEDITKWNAPDGVAEILLSHCMIISLPHLILPMEGLSICTKYARRTATIDSDVRLVLLQRVVEYLQRIEPDADPSRLSACKEAWGITSGHPLVPPGSGLDMVGRLPTLHPSTPVKIQ